MKIFLTSDNNNHHNCFGLKLKPTTTIFSQKCYPSYPAIIDFDDVYIAKFHDASKPAFQIFRIAKNSVQRSKLSNEIYENLAHTSFLVM